MAKKGGKAKGGDLFELDEIDALLARMGVSLPAEGPVAAPADATVADEGEEGPSALLVEVSAPTATAPPRPAARRAGLAPEALAIGKAQISQLLPEDAVVHVDLDVAWARAGAEQGLGAAAEALTGWLQLHKEIGDGVVVSGWLEAARARRCDRCLRALRLRLGGPVQLRYLPEAPAEAADDALAEVSLRPDELDIGWYAGGLLELDAVVCEQLALWLPDPVVCGDVGVERVEADPGACDLPGPAGEAPGPRPSPFAALAGWKPQR